MRDRPRIAPSRSPTGEAAAFRRAGGRSAWKPGEGGGSQDAPGTGKGWGRGRVAMPVEAGPPPQVIDPEDSSRAVKHKLDPSRMPRQLSESGAIPPRGPTSGTRTVSSPSGTSRHAPPPAAQDASRAPSSTAAPAPLRDAPPHVRTSPRAHSFTEQVRLKGPEQSHPPRVEPVASGSGTSGNYRNAPPPHGAAAGAGAADLAKATNTSPASQAPRPPRESPGRIYEADKPADSMRGEHKAPVKWGAAARAARAAAAGAAGAGAGTGAGARPVSNTTHTSKWATQAPAPTPAAGPSSSGSAAPPPAAAAAAPRAAAPAPAPLPAPASGHIAASSPSSSPASPPASKHASPPAAARAPAPAPAPAPVSATAGSSAPTQTEPKTPRDEAIAPSGPEATWKAKAPERSGEVDKTLQKAGDLERQLISLQQRTAAASQRRQALDDKSPRREHWRARDDERRREADQRLASGGGKKSPEELDALMEKMRVMNLEVRNKMEAATQDRARFEAERDARRTAELDRLVEEERQRVQKLSEEEKAEREKKARTAEVRLALSSVSAARPSACSGSGVSSRCCPACCLRSNAER
ncbi:hypothetical protein DMC30DRAFT_108277 [Rhodotorula diobovata]|uniref:Uncharacterized protein n=1 Tax=Rhodotorula diobovata TaxID=5288 RepID=A0A5C5G987_9BASI|nr:hypothetical protein DMC30DRAFT_108277 [Rhodotorula diobovata]